MENPIVDGGGKERGGERRKGKEYELPLKDFRVEMKKV